MKRQKPQPGVFVTTQLILLDDESDPLCRPMLAVRDKYLAFANDVATASRAQRTWIQGRSSLHEWPVISEDAGDGREIGYRVVSQPHGYVFDRAVKGQLLTMPSAALQEFVTFIAELTQLSRKHRLWIRAGTPTTWPRIGRNANNQPEHYVLTPTLNAAGFLMTLAP